VIAFYRLGPGERRPQAAPPPELSVQVWKPAEQGPPGRNAFRSRNRVWWALSKTALFWRPDFAELTFWDRGRLLHRLVVTPRWYRFPFMAPNDLQIGDVWTAPEARGRGLARAGIAEALHQCTEKGDTVWYVAPVDNRASVRLIEACGFRLVAIGSRSRPLGLQMLGRFRIDTRLP
jgi:GNAT superfamily N-acetyltransferase